MEKIRKENIPGARDASASRAPIPVATVVEMVVALRSLLRMIDDHRDSELKIL